MNADTSELQTQMQQLQDELATRESTRHYAHAAVSIMVSLVFAGASAKLFWDSIRLPIFGFAAGTVSAGLLAYSLIHFLRGRRVARHELQRFQSLQEIRRTLQVDDPPSLLPR